MLRKTKRPTRQKLTYYRIHNAKSYNLDELAKVINRHELTVLDYIKKGMPVISKHPEYLIKGIDAKNFLETRAKKNQRPLGAGEFYCPRCKESAISLADKIDWAETDRLLGSGVRQIIITGICQKCNCRLNRFSSEDKFNDFLDAVTKPGKVAGENAGVLVETSHPFLNTQKSEKSGEVQNDK